jgi:16S rRNA (uracil1498-N3)-methyltransferase
VTAPRFFVPEASADGPVLISGDEAQHLTRVLRLRAGDSVRIFDGRGREWLGRIATLGRASAAVEIDAPVDPVREPPVQVTVAVGVLKGDQMDTVVRDATMLGAAAILPLASAHVSVPPRAWRSGAVAERWRRVAVASAKQCGRAVVPAIAPVTDFKAALDATVERLVMCVEPSARMRTAGRHERMKARPRSALVLIGPEGGWSAEEIALAEARGAVALGLGPRTLRAESAPTVALTALWSMWGWE